MLRIPGYKAAEIQGDFTEGHVLFWTEALRAILKGTLRHVNNRERKGPSQGATQHPDPHERRLYAPNFEDRSEEATLKQERCARWVAWKTANSIHKLRAKDKAIFYSPSAV